MSSQPGKTSFFEKLATFIVDKRNLIFFLYAIAIAASLVTQKLGPRVRRSNGVSAGEHRDPPGPGHYE